MIEPRRTIDIIRAASRQHRKVPVTLVVSTDWKSSRLIPIITASAVMPALATSTSSRRYLRRMSWNSPRTDCSSATSAWTASATPPAASIFSTVARAPGSSRL